MGCCGGSVPPPKPSAQLPYAEIETKVVPTKTILSVPPPPHPPLPLPPLPPPPPVVHKCCDYFAGMQGEFVCNGGSCCRQRLDGTVWGGEEFLLPALSLSQREQLSPEAAEAYNCFITKHGGKARVYSAHSALCKAAIHAGVISPFGKSGNVDDDDAPIKFRVIFFQQQQQPASPSNSQRVGCRQESPIRGAIPIQRWSAEMIEGSASNGIASETASGSLSSWICIVAAKD